MSNTYARLNLSYVLYKTQDHTFVFISVMNINGFSH